jgi:hypothetical protein
LKFAAKSASFSSDMTRRNFRNKLCLASLLLVGFGLCRSQAAEPAKVVQFCEDHLGQKVGNGECSTLAEEALHAGGFKGISGNKPEKGDYVWGHLVYTLDAGTSPTAEGKLEDIEPGDVIQFRDAFFKSKGRTLSFGHHTAVVRSVESDRQTLVILQQNFAGKTVKEGKLHLPSLKKGWIRVYQPVAKKGKEE